MTKYVINHKGEEVISERHQKDFKKESDDEEYSNSEENNITPSNSYTDIDFDDI